jgi:competence protein ComEC
MKKLKIVLQQNNIFYFLLIFSLIYMLIFINFINIKSKYNENDSSLQVKIIDYKKSDDKLVIYAKGKEKILINYCDDINISYGDYIYVKGKLIKPKDNTNFNLFNYKKYLLSNNIKYTVKASNIKILKRNKNIFYKLKNYIFFKIKSLDKSKKYILTFIFADKSYIDKEMYDNYQNLGISHLFAVSGMHISLVTFILLKLLEGKNEVIKYLITFIFLMFYLFLTNYTISMVRACFQFILIFINKLFKLNIDNSNIVIFLFSVLIILNPYIIYNIGFLFSFSISFTLIKFKDMITGDFMIKNIKTSLLSFFVSMPILINNFFKVDFLSIILNIIYIPFVSYILFPLCLITVLFPFFDSFTYFVINFFETITKIFSSINLLTFSITKMNIILVIIYYFIFIWIIKSNDKLKKKIIIAFIFIVFIINNNTIVNNEVHFLDVGQGDSILIRIKSKNILIDTGGNINFNISKNVLIPYFRSSGVKKIDYLILTHGDYDHMGEAINLVENFKVEKVIFNCGPYNDLENELIEVLDKKKIKYYSYIKELNVDNNKLHFLQTKEYDNENENSNVIYMELNGYKFMFMGDAGVEKEKDILEKYNVSKIDVLKIGHHGSKTSSDKNFIDEMNPKYSVISVGKNNRYGHPNKEVLNNLDNSKIYRTDINGEIKIKIKRNNFNIKTYR